MTQLAELIVYSPIDLAIESWIAKSRARSGSTRTPATYRETLGRFRRTLQRFGTDLDGETRAVALIAQQWAADGGVKPSTHNQRLAVLSSFYSHAVKLDLLPVDNPISRVDRASVQGYTQARALAPLSVAEALRRIDRRSMIGKRDYALLRFGLSTGARINAIAQLRMGDFDRGEPLTFTVRRDKGGKTWGRTLDAAASKALRTYLAVLYGPDLDADAAAPVWISFCRSQPGQPLGHKAIREVCQRWLGTTKAHTLRHTFAGTLNEIGAKVTDIQGLLNHSSLATTSTYLRALAGNENPYGEQVGAMYGSGED